MKENQRRVKEREIENLKLRAAIGSRSLNGKKSSGRKGKFRNEKFKCANLRKKGACSERSFKSKKKS